MINKVIKKYSCMNLIQNNFAKIISINNQHLLIVDKKLIIKY